MKVPMHCKGAGVRQALIGILLFCIACDGSDKDQGTVTRMSAGRGPTLAADAIDVVQNLVDAGDPVTETAREVLTIGVVEGPAPLEFGRVGWVEVDPDGNLYVLDSRNRRIRKFDREGSFILEMGSDGGGPGEFNRGPAGQLFGGMSLVGDSALVVHDPWGWKFIYFSLDGELLQDVNLRFPPPQQLLARPTRRVSDLGDCWLLMHHSFPFTDATDSAEAGRHVLIRVATDGSRADTLAAYYQDDRVYRWFDSRRGEFYFKPFAPRWYWTAGADGRITIGHSSAYDLTVYTREGRPAGRFTFDLVPLAVTDDDVQRFIDWFPGRSSRRSRHPQERRIAEDVLRGFEFPSTWPVFDDVLYDDAGWLWVRKTERSGTNMSHWDLFNEGLRYVGAVRVPRLDVFAVVGDRIYARLRDQMGVDFVRVFEFDRPVR
jgi:hypothetical protein